MIMYFFFFRHNSSYELRISDWSSDVCSSDLRVARAADPNASPAVEPAVRKPMRDRLLSVFDLSNLPPVTPLVDGLLYRGTLAQLSGPPGRYKSFLMTAWAVSVASGRDFECHKVSPSGAAVIVAPQGPHGLKQKERASCRDRGVKTVL